LREDVEGWGLVEPVEKAGTVYPYFTTHRLCDASTTLTETIWDPLRRNPGYSKEGIPARTDPRKPQTTEWQAALIEWAAKVEAGQRRGTDFAAIQAKIEAMPIDEVPRFLDRQIPHLFKALPQASLWFVETDSLLSRRFAIMRILLNQELVPDLLESPSERERPGLRMLQEHVVSGTSSALIEPLLLLIPPGTLGFAFDWMPHSIVLLMGMATLLTEDHPPTFASLFSPNVQSGFGFHWRESDFYEDLTPALIEELLPWWVGRLNIIYSYVLDPSRHVDDFGRFLPTRQAAWFLTFERLLVDALLIGSNPQGSGLFLHQAAFDLLDKAEVLLGYGSSVTGKGFQQLLRPSRMLPRLDEIWAERLPSTWEERLKLYSRHLYDRLYEGIKAEAYTHRLTSKGIKVWSEKEERLIDRHWEDYVPKLIRAVRNSSHGLIEQLESPEKRKERNIIAVHSGKLPAELPELAALLAFALVADAERFVEGTWLKPGSVAQKA
jgi:hypothetical protein